MLEAGCGMQEKSPLTPSGSRHSTSCIQAASTRITVRVKAATTARCQWPLGARRQVSGQVNRGDAQRAVALERLEDENEARPLAVVEAGDTLAQGTSIDGLA
jgi:hypothetical protein